MSSIQALILGIVQGLTEFLPISSSGHLVLFQKIFRITESTLTFDTFVHLGTLIAVFVFFWDDIVSILKKPFQKLTWLLVAATIPTVIIAILFKGTFEQLFRSGSTLGYEFIITGLVLLFAERFAKGRKGVRETTYLDAAFIGVLQGLAIAPAISRSGLTISGALFRNLDKDFAARFSFLLSIPAILGAVVFNLRDMMKAGITTETHVLTASIVGTLAAAIVGYFSIKYMIAILKKGRLKYFSYYVFVLGSLIIIDQLVTHIFF